MNPELTAGIVAVLVSALVQITVYSMKKKNGKEVLSTETLVLSLVKDHAELDGRVTQQLKGIEMEQKRVQDEIGRFRDDLRRMSDILAGCKYCRLREEQ